MADDERSIPKGRVRRTAQVGTVIGSQGARWAGTRAANLTRSKEEAAAQLDKRHLEAAACFKVIRTDPGHPGVPGNGDGSIEKSPENEQRHGRHGHRHYDGR